MIYNVATAKRGFDEASVFSEFDFHAQAKSTT